MARPRHRKSGPSTTWLVGYGNLIRRPTGVSEGNPTVSRAALIETGGVPLRLTTDSLPRGSVRTAGMAGARSLVPQAEFVFPVGSRLQPPSRVSPGSLPVVLLTALHWAADRRYWSKSAGGVKLNQVLSKEITMAADSVTSSSSAAASALRRNAENQQTQQIQAEKQEPKVRSVAKKQEEAPCPVVNAEARPPARGSTSPPDFPRREGSHGDFVALRKPAIVPLAQAQRAAEQAEQAASRPAAASDAAQREADRRTARSPKLQSDQAEGSADNARQGAAS